MKKLMILTTLGVAGVVTIALMAMTAGATSADDTPYTKREDDRPALVLVDDEDDDTRDTDTTRDTDSTGDSRDSRDSRDDSWDDSRDDSWDDSRDDTR